MNEATAGWDWAGARRHCLTEARRLLRNADDAEEAVQEALARAWRKRDACRQRDAYRAWLTQITRNEAFRLLARRRLRDEREVPEETTTEPSTGEATESILGMLATEQALSALTREERALIHLRYMQDLTQPEVARLLDMPEGTVKVRLHRIRRRLRTALAEAA